MELALNTAGLDFSSTDQAVVAFATYEVGGEVHSGPWWFQQPSNQACRPATYYARVALALCLG